MILVIPATRNSVLTWFLGMAFDHVVIYHRFFGRFTIFCVIIHFGYFARRFRHHYDELVYVTGFFAMLFGCLNYITSIAYFRRKMFNVFYWSHYGFIGFYVLAWLHVPQTHPFLIIGAGLYALDKFLRLIWMSLPRKMLVFRNKGKSIAQVRFEKSQVTQWLGMHKVGQYYFVNFPALSLTEWHPFSVSSGPREDSVELHIRALGDHTKEIVALATDKATKAGGNDTTTYIRVDGPYGLHDFNFRRFPVMLLVGGGVGITPVMGMLKDIYNVGRYTETERKRVLPHCVEMVYAVWVMPNEEDFNCFKDELNECMVMAVSE